MKLSHAAIVGVVASVAINAAISAVTGTVTELAATPVGVPVYLVPGNRAPPALVGRRSGSSPQLGLGALASTAGLATLGPGALGGGMLADWGAGFLDLLFVPCGGVVL